MAWSLNLKQAYGRIFDFSQSSRWWPLVKGPISTKIDPTNYISALHLDSFHLTWTKFGIGILAKQETSVWNNFSLNQTLPSVVKN